MEDKKMENDSIKEREEKRRKFKDDISSLMFTGALVFIGAVSGYILARDRQIPTYFGVLTDGFVDPNELEIMLKDIDENGSKETLIEYKDKSYLFLLDETDTPFLKKYKVTPLSIVPGE
nr:hypothetical protein [Nanoarchaeum sp.]